MRHAIDPKIDCVFKALLGSEENRNLLIHFLNAFLAQDLIEPLVWVEILNPYNDKEFLSDKLSIVDVKARDSHDRLYQIEIQLTSYGHLPARIIYNWADIYSQQLKSGQDYLELRPTYSIWLLAENLISADNETVHHYKMRDEQGNTLTQHGGIWLLELKKFKANHIETEDQRWLKFFREGEQLNDEALPDWMITREMKQAMSTLSTFSEKDQHYYQYQARQEYLREQRTIQHELEQARRALLQANQREEAAQKREELALQDKQASQQREELALAEIKQLKALLAKKMQ
jgi:predicted transposase/invertase (TIGR01784 family)